MSLFHVESKGFDETKAAFDELTKAVDGIDKGELRSASVSAAGELAGALAAAAAGSGVPVAARVARSVRPKAGGWPGVSIGGGVPVGRDGAIAAKLLWGSERGPASSPNRFGVGANAGGYWIAPTTAAFKAGPGMARFRAAVDRLIRKARLA